jgi:hypothetical protein
MAWNTCKINYNNRYIAGMAFRSAKRPDIKISGGKIEPAPQWQSSQSTWLQKVE